MILCEDGSLYTGYSPDPERRFLEHQKGRGGRYTRSHKPVKLIYREELRTKSDALRREIEIKKWPREEKILKLKLKKGISHLKLR
jgi:putative endonuclease